jgi:pimeloyl-ACP methyl ester carboxylesterase
MNAIVHRRSHVVVRSSASAALASLFVAATLAVSAQSAHAQGTAMTKPTVVLVHGAFAESSSWNPVTAKLLAKGYPVVAIANPLRGVKSDATYLGNLLRSINSRSSSSATRTGATSSATSQQPGPTSRRWSSSQGLRPTSARARRRSPVSIRAARSGQPSRRSCSKIEATTYTSSRTNTTPSSRQTCLPETRS